MGRETKRADRKQLHVWILRNQVEAMEKIKEVRGITKTDAIAEALSLWFSLMRKEGVL